MAFSMEITNTEALQKQIEEEVKPVPEELQQLRKMAEANVSELLTMDYEELDKRKNTVQSIEQFGMDSLQKSAQKNSMLQVSMGDLSKLGDESSSVSQSLLELQHVIKDLDPGGVDFSKKGLFGKLFNPLQSYFERYQKADSVIGDIVASLDKGKNTLKNDNTTLEIEEQALRDLTKRLKKEIELGAVMDDVLATRLDEAKAANEDPGKIKFISEEILFPLRQRIMDLQQMIVVNQQGIIAIEVIRRNNNELIRGVERAKSVTISAMRIAVIVASALYNQKIVLNKIQALNQTTNELISGTSKMLKEQGAEIHRQSMETGVSIETLKTSFQDVMEAMEAISTFKQEALPRMKDTILQFRELADKGEQQIQILERGNRVSLDQKSSKK